MAKPLELGMVVGFWLGLRLVGRRGPRTRVPVPLGCRSPASPKEIGKAKAGGKDRQEGNWQVVPGSSEPVPVRLGKPGNAVAPGECPATVSPKRCSFPPPPTFFSSSPHSSFFPPLLFLPLLPPPSSLPSGVPSSLTQEDMEVTEAARGFLRRGELCLGIV